MAAPAPAASSALRAWRRVNIVPLYPLPASRCAGQPAGFRDILLVMTYANRKNYTDNFTKVGDQTRHEWKNHFVASVLAGVLGKQVRELLLEGFNLGAVANQDVGMVGILEGEVLVIVLRPIKTLQRDNLRDDLCREDFGGVQLRYVGLCDSLLFRVGIENS